jgi:hypothetical protein
MMKPFAVLLLLVSACATQPPAPSAPPGTDERAQQEYMQTLEKCQEAHRWDNPADGGIGALPTKDDADFSACMKNAKDALARAEGVDAGS